MVLVFDMDDTLYDELSYVSSGFRAVGRMLAPICDASETELTHEMQRILTQTGRGDIFDRLLVRYGRFNKALVIQCVQTYRSHRPSIALWPEAEQCLARHAHLPIYIVTDGNVVAQQAKADALGLFSRTKRVLLTHRFGIRHAKPSPHCFQRIAQWENVSPEQVTYVADNPAKDFVGIRPLGFRTVRVLTGQHAATRALPGHDAECVVSSLTELDLAA